MLACNTKHNMQPLWFSAFPLFDAFLELHRQVVLKIIRDSSATIWNLQALATPARSIAHHACLTVSNTLLLFARPLFACLTTPTIIHATLDGLFVHPHTIPSYQLLVLLSI